MDREGEVFNQRGGWGGKALPFFFRGVGVFLRTKCVFGSVENIGIHKTPRIFFMGGWWGWFLCDILFWRENSIIRRPLEAEHKNNLNHMKYCCFDLRFFAVD